MKKVKDKSGNGNDLTQNDPVLQPISMRGKYAAQQKSEIPTLTDSFRVVLNEVQELIDYPNGVPQSYLKLIWNHLSDAITEMEQKSEIKMPTGEEMKKRQKDKAAYLRELGYPPRVIVKYQDAIKETWEWIHNKITGQ